MRVVIAGLVAASLTLVSACGWLLYPKRAGRTRGYIDPLVLLMDVAWLFVGIVPGVIALAVDFTTGCIYMSGRRRGSTDTDTPVMVQIPVEEMSRERINSVISAYTGVDNVLDHPGLQVSEVTTLAEAVSGLSQHGFGPYEAELPGTPQAPR